MSDDPLPVTLDNIRKWDADMRGSDDRARHIALYYFATNLREVVEMLLAELAEDALDSQTARTRIAELESGKAKAVSGAELEARLAAMMEESAGELERLDGFGEWHEAAQAIRALKSRKGTGDE